MFKTFISRIENMFHEGAEEILSDLKEKELNIESAITHLRATFESKFSDEEKEIFDSLENKIKEVHADEFKIASAKSVLSLAIKNVLPILKLDANKDLVPLLENVISNIGKPVTPVTSAIEEEEKVLTDTDTPVATLIPLPSSDTPATSI